MNVYKTDVENHTPENIKGEIKPDERGKFTEEERNGMSELLKGFEIEDEMIEHFITYAEENGLVLNGGKDIISNYYMYINVLEENVYVDENTCLFSVTLYCKYIV